MTDFPTFFAKATRGREPYPFQEQFATADELPHLLRAPTGAGKTATAVLGWLWRWRQKLPGTPRRLVYCLPMRVLVEQSASEAQSWVENLKLDIPVQVLMGGVETEKWYLHPEKPAILIGTQDMLLSRALNRGYGENRFHWPIDFGLLNNDCLWVFDEPQLMGSGVSTSAQLAGLRQQLATFGSCESVWMSATLEPSWLDTVDFVGKFPAKPLELSKADYDPKKPLHKRMTAAKTLERLDATSTKDMKDVASKVMKLHESGTQTLVIINIVDRAKAVYNELLKLRKKSETPQLLLVHSRFRPHEREKLNDQLQLKDVGDRILVATQVVEAGVDISSRTLITELCPWASMVQRIGRCNRTGDDGPGHVFWIDLDEKQSLPYLPIDLEFSREQTEKLEGEKVSPKALEDFKTEQEITLPFEHKHVLRRRDLLDLFDTSPDLSGNDIDIQRFVRGDDPDTDVQVFWRTWIGDNPPSTLPTPHRSELCNVPVGSIKQFLKKGEKRTGYVWDHLEEEWRSIGDTERDIRPGLMILLPATIGGYSELGWDPESLVPVKPVEIEITPPPESTSSDPNSCGPALTIAKHTQHVYDELDAILKKTRVLSDSWPGYLQTAARWHDAGKAHWVFQESMHRANSSLERSKHWAKSGVSKRLQHGRRYFRHELASALAALQHQLPFAVAYLIATHHGKVRLSIRSLPDEDSPPDPATRFALGLHHGDNLPDVDLGGENCGAVILDLSPMQLGGESSWTGQALVLLKELGPFKLAYLEALLRAADMRASQQEQKAVTQ